MKKIRLYSSALIAALYLLIFMINSIFMESAIAQDIELEKTYILKKETRKGFLGDVKYNEQNGSYLLSYCTKSKKNYARFANYTFDKDFNFVNMDQEELESDKAKNKYSWWSYKGEEYSVESIIADDNASGTLILRKVRSNYGWSWYWGMYTVTTAILDKVKLRSDDGEKYYYYASARSYKTNELFVLCGKKDKNDLDAYKKDFHILKINFALDVVKVYKVSFPNSVEFKYFATYTDEMQDNQIFILFNSGSDYTFVRVDSDLVQKDKIDFIANSEWKVDNFIPPLTLLDEIYIYGPSADKYYTLAKIEKGKLGYVSDVNIEEFQQKLKCPPLQKKTPEYRGKKFNQLRSMITQENELVITGQNWASKYSVSYKKFRDVYTDVVAFYFDKEGKLKAQYGVDPKINSEDVKLNGNKQGLLEGKNYIYWILYESLAYNTYYPTIMKIDKKALEINDPLVLGNETYTLEPSFPYLDFRDENKVVYFGTNKKGNTIWFCKVKFE